jgi:hypothetical protein
MAGGPRITPYWLHCEDDYAIAYQAKCCVNYKGFAAHDLGKVKVKLSSHLSQKHGIVKHPTTLQTDKVPDLEE